MLATRQRLSWHFPSMACCIIRALQAQYIIHEPSPTIPSHPLDPLGEWSPMSSGMLPIADINAQSPALAGLVFRGAIEGKHRAFGTGRRRQAGPALALAM